MLKLLKALDERLSFKAPRQMSGPNVYRFNREVQDHYEGEKQGVVIDFSEVDYIDLHGLILLRDLCEMVGYCGGRVYASQVSSEMQNLLLEVNMLGAREDNEQGQYELKSA